MKKTFLSACTALLLTLPPLEAATPQSAAPDLLRHGKADTIGSNEHEVLYLSLPLPQGLEMDFALVPVTTNSNLFAAEALSLGNAAAKPSTLASYLARSTPTVVSGSVYHNGCWYILMGKTEVTWAQYAAVMQFYETEKEKGKKKSAPAKAAKPFTTELAERYAAAMGKAAKDVIDEVAELPATNITHAQIAQFMEALNAWFAGTPASAKAMKQLAGFGLYARLPMEVEWEYCARGATYTQDKNYSDKGGFYEPTPYGDILSDYEVFYSSTASNRVTRVGSRKPNPCGLYDMLGNASEMVADAFSPGYLQGRVGGLLIRGGSARDSKENITSYKRTEYNPYPKGRPFRNAFTGFRVTLGSVIMSDTRDDIKKKILSDWGQHVNPASAPSLSTTAKVDSEIFDLSQCLESLNQQLNRLPAGDPQLNNLRSTGNKVVHNLENIQSTLAKADMESAATGIYMIYISSGYCAHDLRRVRYMEEELKQAEADERQDLQDVIEQAKLNINGHWETFCMGCDLLARSESPYEGSTTVERGYQEKAEQLKAKGLEFQLPRLKAAYETFRHYQQSGNVPNSELRKTWLDAIGGILDAEEK